MEFADGQSVATITISVIDDSQPEGDETILITLVGVDEGGTGLTNKGATIGIEAHDYLSSNPTVGQP